MPKKILFHGHSVVAPLTGKDGATLVAPLEDYITSLGVSVEEWFKLDEQQRKDLIRKRDDYRGWITGNESSQVHEVQGKGRSGGVSALVPWNQGVFVQLWHTRLQRHQVTILRFDPLDTRSMNTKQAHGCLIAFGLDGKIMPESDLDIYSRPSPELAEQFHKDFLIVKEYYAAKRANPYQVAPALKRLHDGDAHIHLGFDSYNSMLGDAEVRGDTAEDKRLRRLAEFIDSSSVTEVVSFLNTDNEKPHWTIKAISPKVLDKIRREWDNMNDQERARWLSSAKANSQSDFNDSWHLTFGRHRTQKFVSVPPGSEIIPSETADDVEGECVVRVGHIERGADKLKGANE